LALKVEYILFADKSVEEKGTGKMSLIGIFQTVNPGLPIIPTMAMYCLMKGNPGQHKCKVRIRHTGPGAERFKANTMPEMSADFVIPENGIAQFVLNFIGLPVIGNKIEFSIYEEDNLIKSASIPIEKQGGPAHAVNNR
jgi:hypothetical protein